MTTKTLCPCCWWESHICCGSILVFVSFWSIVLLLFQIMIVIISTRQIKMTVDLKPNLNQQNINVIQGW